MPPIVTTARPYRNRISVSVPREYGAHSFHVILIPVDATDTSRLQDTANTESCSFVDALLSCPKLDVGEKLDISRNHGDYGREVVL